MFLCFIPPKLMMLRRLAENVTGSSASQAQAVDMDRARRWWGGEGWPRRPETARAADDVQSDGCCSCGVERDGHGCA